MDLSVIVDKLLDMNPDPIPKFVLLKEFKGLSPDSIEYQNAYERVCHHHFVKRLEESQNEKGFWYPFHGDTEGIIRLLLSYGLDKKHPCLKKVIEHMTKLLNKEVDYDCYEKQDNIRWWPEIFMPLAISATLSMVDNTNEILDLHRKRWSAFTEISMREANYNEFQKMDFQVFNKTDPHKKGYDYEADRKAQYDYFKIKTNRIIPPFNYYNLLLLAPHNGNSSLSIDADKALVDYCMNEADGIYYVYNNNPGRMVQLNEENRDSRSFCHWVRAMSLISKFNGWAKYEQKYYDWILAQLNQDGLLAFPKKYSLFALSDSWRGSKRAIDSTIYVLRFLMKKQAI